MSGLSDSLKQIDGVSTIKKQWDAGNVAAALLGIGFIGFTLYTLHLTVKANRVSIVANTLQIRKLNDEGYK